MKALMRIMSRVRNRPSRPLLSLGEQSQKTFQGVENGACEMRGWRSLC
jgi:hypothetical protein